MIVQAFLDLLHGLAVSLFDFIESLVPDAPDFITDLGDGLATVVALIPEPVRWFVPLGPAVTIGVTVAGLFLAAGAIRLVRRVVSLLSGGGGNA